MTITDTYRVQTFLDGFEYTDENGVHHEAEDFEDRDLIDIVTFIGNDGRTYRTDLPGIEVEGPESGVLAFMDRSNDEYVRDALTSADPTPLPDHDEFAGYTRLPYPGVAHVCWYCNEQIVCLWNEWEGRKVYVAALLTHLMEHRANADEPFITSYFPGKDIVRPDGSVAAKRPGVLRVWQAPETDRVACARLVEERRHAGERRFITAYKHSL